MSNQRSYIALNWVTQEIIDTLDQASAALKAYIGNPEDVTKLRFCLTYIHQVTGGLTMVELHAASVLSKTLETLIAHIINQTQEVQNNLLTAAQQTIAALADYVQHVNATHQSDSKPLLDNINRIRELIQLDTVSPAEMFNPNIAAARVTKKQKPRMTEADFNALILKLDKAFLHALNHLSNRFDIEKNINLLNKITASLYKVSKSTISEPLWHIVFAIVEYLQQYPNELSDESIKALKLSYQEVLSLKQSGIDGLATPPSSQLLKSLLYSVAITENTTKNISQLRQQYQLDQALSEPAPETALEDKTFDNFVASTVYLLESQDPNLIVAANRAIELIRQSISGLDLTTLAAKIDDLKALSLNKQQAEQFFTVYNEFIQGVRLQIDASREQLIAYIDSEFNAFHLSNLPVALYQQAQSLYVSNTYELSAILLAAHTYVQQLSQTSEVDTKALEHLADAISAIDYYLECLFAESPQQLANIIGNAKSQIEQLQLAEQPDFDEFIASLGNQDATTSEIEVESTIETTASESVESFILGDDTDEEILDIFIEEAGEVLEEIHTELPKLNNNFADNDALLNLRRCFHTLKGSGRMVGAEHIGEMAWSVEELLNKQRDGLLAVNSDTISLIELASAKLPEILTTLKQRTPYPLTNIQAVITQAQHIISGTTAEFEQTTESIDSQDTGSISAEEENQEHIDPELLAIFIAEAETHIQAFSEFLDTINPGYEDSYISSELQRALHTLKGSAYMAEIVNMAELATVLEGFVKDLANFQCLVDAEILALLIRSCQALEQQLSLLQEGNDKPIDKQQELIEEIKLLHQERLATHEHHGEDSNVLTDKYTSLLSNALDSMTDSADLLMLWQNKGLTNEQQQELFEATNKLATTADAANYPTIAVLANALADYYQHAKAHPNIVTADFFELADRAQEELEDILDIIAAQQTAELDQALIQQLQQAITIEEHIIDEPAQEQGTGEITPEVTTAYTEQTSNLGQLLDEIQQADEELLEIFSEELTDLCEELENSAQASLLEQQIQQSDIDQLKRILHTIKGGARMAELASLGDVTHDYETMLEKAEREQVFDASFFQQLAAYQQQVLSLADAVFNPQAAKARMAATANVAIEAPILAVDVNTATTEEAITTETIETIEPVLTSEAGKVEPIELEQAVELASMAETIEDASVDSGSTDNQFLQALQAEIQVADADTLEIFIEEMSELVSSLETALLECIEQQNADAIKRILHTIKGGARMAELPTLGDFSHEFESFIEAYENQGFDDIKEQLYQFLDQLQLMVDALLSGNTAPSVEEATDTTETAPQTIETQETTTVAAEKVEVANEIIPASNIIPIHKGIDLTNVSQAAIEATRKFIDNFNQEQQNTTKRESIRVAPELLENLINLAGENIIARSRLEEQMSELRFSLDEMDATVDRLHAQLRRLEIETEAQITFRQEQVNIEGLESFDPLEMDRYSQMQQLSKSLIESASDIDDLSATFTHKMRDIDTLIIQQSRVNSELQEGLMRFQMVPFSRMVPRLRRIVRQIAQELGKQVQLEVENAEGELDRTILEKIIAPLEHMLRNAVDHGIESPDVREKLGKPAMGTITIRLSREGGEILLTLSDDGAGINLDAVRNKAIERGLLSADASISDHEAMQFILAAGFTTATEVTQISGRGVGMDVVNSEIKQIGGGLSVDSSRGQGSVFSVRLPFTVSINRALMVSIDSDTFAIPLTSIEGIVRVSPYELEAYYKPDAPLFDYAGRAYNLRYLGSLLNRGSVKFNEMLTPLPVILIRSADYSIAVQVDRLLGSREIVVKSLGPQFSMVQGLSGATVLGDGSVVVILDMMALIRSDISRGLISEADAIAAKETQITEASNKATHVMVVDDSVTVRKVTTRLLERYDLEVSVARDGLDAITLLQETENLPDIMLLDIEMPRMDGFEVLSRLRHSERLKHIPVVMITSRTGDKHRERALSLGANHYLGKPFQESELLGVIGELTHTDILQAQ